MATPSDLFTAADSLDCGRLLGVWKSLLKKDYAVLGFSAFGDLFLFDREGLVDMLDLTSGEVGRVAMCREEFEWDIAAGNHDELLLKPLVEKLLSSGVKRAANECYAFRQPPMLGGQCEPANVVVWDLYQYHEGLSKLFPQVMRLPLGTEVRVQPRTR